MPGQLLGRDGHSAVSQHRCQRSRTALVSRLRKERHVLNGCTFQKVLALSLMRATTGDEGEYQADGPSKSASNHFSDLHENVGHAG